MLFRRVHFQNALGFPTLSHVEVLRIEPYALLLTMHRTFDQFVNASELDCRGEDTPLLDSSGVGVV
jgi:hypothetical protein